MRRQGRQLYGAVSLASLILSKALVLLKHQHRRLMGNCKSNRAVTLFLNDGRMALHDNLAERALCPNGIGRKNWLFKGLTSV
jgi:hypothetical protein